MRPAARLGRVAMLVLAGTAGASDLQPRPRADALPPVTHASDLVYPAEFFLPFRPQTALDMLERVPGFILSEGTELRGFGGASGNVLIDGQRPTVKAGGITQVLQRIPAATVASLVLLRGGEGSEAQGQTLIANIVRRRDVETSGTASVQLMRTFDGRWSPAARLGHARGLGAWQADFDLSAELDYFPATSRYRVHDADGALVESRSERRFGRSPAAAAALSAHRPLAGGAFTLNVQLGHEQDRMRHRVALHAGDFDVPSSERQDIGWWEAGQFAELGLDWARPLTNDWTVKLVGLGRLEHFDAEEEFSASGYRGVSALHQRPLELIGRATFGRAGDRRLQPEMGMEIAWNALSSHLDYAEDLGAGLIPIALSGADTHVTELRAEAFANLVAKLGGDFSAEATLAIEGSRIAAQSDASSTRNLAYLKPAATLVWSPAATTDVRLGVRRTVDQLDFGDFAASVDQADGRPLGGNAQLRPARITQASLRADHRWGSGNAIAPELFHRWHRGWLGYIQLPAGEQALGAVGHAREWGVTLQSTLSMAALLPGVQLTLDATLRGSRVGEESGSRPIDDLPDRSLAVELRHDIQRLRAAWGVRYTAPESARIQFIDEHYHWRDGAHWSAYLETMAFAGFKAVLTIDGLAGRRSSRLRQFLPGAANGAPGGRETRRTQEGRSITLLLTRPLS